MSYASLQGLAYAVTGGICVVAVAIIFRHHFHNVLVKIRELRDRVTGSRARANSNRTTNNSVTLSILTQMAQNHQLDDEEGTGSASLTRSEMAALARIVGRQSNETVERVYPQITPYWSSLRMALLHDPPYDLPPCYDEALESSPVPSIYVDEEGTCGKSLTELPVYSVYTIPEDNLPPPPKYADIGIR